MATHQRFTLRLSWPRNLLPKERKTLFKEHSNERYTEALQTPERREAKEREEGKRKGREKRCRGNHTSMIISCARSTVSISLPQRSSARMALSGPKAPLSLRYSPSMHHLSFSFRLGDDWKFVPLHPIFLCRNVDPITGSLMNDDLID